MGPRALLCLALLLAGTVRAQTVTRLDDTLRDPSRLRTWEPMEGVDGRPGAGAARVRNDVAVVAGAIRTPFRQPGADALNFEATVRVFLPARAAEGTSAALLVLGPGGETRLAATVVTDKAGLPTDACEIGIEGLRLARAPLRREAWHILRIRVDEGVAEVGLRPEGGDEAKVEGIDVSGLLPSVAASVGLRAWATPLAFRQLSVTAVRLPESLPTVVSAAGVRAEVNRRGCLTAVHLRRGAVFDTFRFRTDAARGPAWLVDVDGRTASPVLQPSDAIRGLYTGKVGPVACSLLYRARKEVLEVEAALENLGDVDWKPTRAALRLGLDTEATSAARWRATPAPTFLRREPTHAWACAATPDGAWLGLACPDPVDAWQAGETAVAMPGLVVLGGSPSEPAMRPGERRAWRLRLFSVADAAAAPARLGEQAGACFPDLAGATLEPGEPMVLAGFARPGETRRVTVTGPDGTTAEIYPLNRRDTLDDDELRRALAAGGVENPDSLRFQPGEAPGRWRVRIEHSEPARDADGEAMPSKDGREAVDAVRVSELTVAVRKPWSRLVGAEPASAPHLDLAGARGAEVAAVARAAAAHARRRAQGGDITELELASALADVLLTRQPALGAADPAWHGVLAVMAEELREVDAPVWRQRHDRHEAALARVVSELVSHLDALPGDGPRGPSPERLASSAALLARWSARLAPSADRTRCQQASLELLRLGQSRAPAFAEADTGPGWADRIRAEFLLYAQTGRESLLRAACNGLGAGAPPDDTGGEWDRCVREFALGKAYVVIRADGSYWGRNCAVERRDGVLTVTPAEACVTEVHVNSRWPASKVRVRFAGQAPTKPEVIEGLRWVRAGK